MARKKYRFENHTEIKAEHVQPIIDLLKQGKKDDANKVFHELCLSVRDIKHFEAFHLAQKIKQEASK